MIYGVKQSPESVHLSRNLSWNPPVNVANALAQAAAALFSVASAFQGEGTFAAQPPPVSKLTVAEAINEFLLAKARAGKSDRYLRALRNSLCKFAADLGEAAIAEVTHRAVEKWLHSHGWQPRTQKGYLGDVRTLFNFHLRRGQVAVNAGNAVEVPQQSEPPPSIHTPDQVRAALNACQAWDLNLCRLLAIRYFAGLRSSEADRLREAEIGGKYIEVSAAKAKTRRRRLIPIAPTLRAWLDLGGSIDFGDYGNRFRHFYKASGLLWPHNVTRHTFVSYHLAAFQNAARTALEAGHTEQMLFAHYREVVTPEAAADFWAILPSQRPNAAGVAT